MNYDKMSQLIDEIAKEVDNNPDYSFKSYTECIDIELKKRGIDITDFYEEDLLKKLVMCDNNMEIMEKFTNSFTSKFAITMQLARKKVMGK